MPPLARAQAPAPCAGRRRRPCRCCAPAAFPAPAKRRSAQHVEVGLEAAVGDDHRRRAEFLHAVRLLHLDFDAAGHELQRAARACRAGCGPGASAKIRLEPLQRDVGAVVLPGQAVTLPPWRRQHVGAVAAEIDQLDAFALEPLHQPPAILGHGARQVLPREAVGRRVDLGAAARPPACPGR